MAETVKKAKSTGAKPKKTAAKKSATAASADPIAHNQATEHAHSRENGHRPASQDEIARLAHQFWQERGHKHGHHIEDWYRAEKELRKRAS